MINRSAKRVIHYALNGRQPRMTGNVFQQTEQAAHFLSATHPIQCR